MRDLISRQAAIDAVNNAFDRETLLTGFVRSIAVRAIRDMQSAQPDTRLEKIADLVDGSIDHFDLEDAMDLLYQIKDVLNG